MRSIRVLYTVAVLSLAGLFLVPDPFLHGIAALLLIVGALPMFRYLEDMIGQRFLEHLRTRVTGEEPAVAHQDRLTDHQSPKEDAA